MSMDYIDEKSLLQDIILSVCISILTLFWSDGSSCIVPCLTVSPVDPLVIEQKCKFDNY